MNDLNPIGFLRLLGEFLNHMQTRKTVAMFTDYTAAKEDVLTELIGKYEFSPEQAAAARKAVEIYERETYIQEYWEKL